MYVLVTIFETFLCFNFAAILSNNKIILIEISNWEKYSLEYFIT